MRMAVSRGIAFAMNVIVIRLIEGGRKIRQFSIRRIYDYRRSARLVVERLLPFDIECRHDCRVAPDSLQIRVAGGLPRRLKLRRLSECGNRNQQKEKSHVKFLPLRRARW